MVLNVAREVEGSEGGAVAVGRGLTSVANSRMIHYVIDAMQVLKPEMLETVVDGAARVFTQVSYRHAMMSDIAAEAGVALATLYRYADTKEALFELALRRGFGMPMDVLWTSTRSQAGFRVNVEAFIRERFALLSPPPLLAAAAERRAPADLHAECLAISGELYDAIDQYRVGIRILDRSAADWPSLSRLFLDRVRGPVLALLSRYLTRRVHEAALPALPDIPAAARVVLETCATLAMHRHFTVGGSYATDGMARATALHFIAGGLMSQLPSARGRRRSSPRR